MKLRMLNIWDGHEAGFSVGDLCIEGSQFVEDTMHDSRDMSGLYAIPGLIDAHVHMCLDPDITDPLAQADAPRSDRLAAMRIRAEKMVQAGITTARDLGGGDYTELELRDEIAAGKTPGPRLICAGQPVTSVGGHCHFWGGEASDTDSALAVLERQREKGVDLIKIMVTGGNITPGSRPVDSQFEDATIHELVSRATAHEYHVAAHCHGTRGIGQAARAGVTTVEHCSWVGDEGWGRAFDEEIVQVMADGGVWVSPTINAGWKRFRKAEFVEMVQRNYSAMKSAGVRLIASTDAGIPNVRHEDLPKALPEFARFAELSALEVLKSATSDCAEAIGLGEVTGRIAPGWSADFVVYDGNPMDDLEKLTAPVMVVSQGKEITL